MTQNGVRKHTIVALVQDRPGVLNRIASMFRRRGFNIASLAVGASELPGLSRMTFVVAVENDQVLAQVTKQLRKVIEVVRVEDLTSEDIVARELCLVKVKAASANVRSEIIQVIELFRAKIVDVSADSVTVEITGDEDKIASILTLLKGFGIVEIMRTGRIAMVRGKKAPLKGREPVGAGKGAK
ncbi:MAG: acetolactate synthase small subunit [Chloroflexi bacterium]|nr:acetolactate synthase small subunit [Chloroflexota bacterium]